ncbi:anthranilate synthase component II [Rathayibacter iranicus]|uniref:Aminodeoxychorismate/anthranilate synthase component II n=2 Tax=Rathayibacter iranicus TaxID=59737 RepID=A0AAD1EMW0_9MICO|nr:aminodeoxychorismate/anthranilate synthase component II [Rathayibacter iranicus]AZZ56592.1 aminodeoxychorismate/anthranilate synthase component II [Rathayibacter iranicus]MWV32387.1 aminodeoxychorismate/anthranilate synthase component II [Rathayibacter iranicus NCPPB 2253 = VKM Ac-1602]PPI43405.1 aminodeoxychorismate/anthranilate synthase component II [Rathayibacter iranicus]PPI58449.1 aminodeoxychorismate/anthranilate synthase component II [Rathayibacter iranicus]PPI69549.1 aminodeoxychori
MTEGVAPRILVVDHHDSFVFTLVSYLRELGAEVEVVEATDLGDDQVSELMARAEGILISPGPGHPQDVPASSVLVRQALALSRPVLGVCLGHQILAHALGAYVAAAPELMHGRTSRVLHDGDPLFAGIASGFAAMRYHSLAVDTESLPRELEVIATTEEGVVMAVRHRDAPLVGVQFHPESVLTEGGHRLLGNWLTTM